MSHMPYNLYSPPPYHPYRSMPYNPTHSLSHIPLGNEQIPEQTPKTGGNVESDARHPYSAAETEKLFKVWVATSDDLVVGNQQNRKVFWERVTATYNAMRPERTPPCRFKMLLCHFERVSPKIQRFAGIYNNKERQCRSGMNESDILKSAIMIYQHDIKRPFKYVNTWKRVRGIDKWVGGTQ